VEQSPAQRRTARIAGVWFALTFVASIPAVLLYDPLLNHTDYILGAGDDTRVGLGAVLEVILAISNIGTAVVLYPILKRQSQSISLGYVASRTVESAIIIVGLVSVMSLVTLRQDVGGVGATDGASLVIAGRSLVAFHDWTFILGPNFCAAFGNGILLGYLMFKSGLVPPRMALLGLIGGPLLFLSSCLILLDVIDHGSGISNVLAVPEILWEASVTIYLIAKGFRPSPILGSTGDGRDRVNAPAV
jgi:hypothetical protein